MKWAVVIASCLVMSQAAPVAEPEAFLGTLGAVALPAITGSALIDGLLLGKVAFLKAAILANLLLADNGGDDHYAVQDSYGAPHESYGAPQESYGAPQESYGAPVDSYGAPAVSYEEPAPQYHEPAPQYQEPAPQYHEPAPQYAPAGDSYGAPAANPVDSYGSPQGPARQY